MIECQELMTHPVFTLHEDASVADARRLMHQRHVRHIPIVDKKDRLVGIFTQRDLLAHMDSAMYGMSEEELEVQEADLPIKEVMSTKVATASLHTPLRQAALFLQNKRYGCLPIVDGKQVVGIITDSDFVQIAINLLEQMEESAPLEND